MLFLSVVVFVRSKIFLAILIVSLFFACIYAEQIDLPDPYADEAPPPAEQPAQQSPSYSGSSGGSGGGSLAVPIPPSYGSAADSQNSESQEQQNETVQVQEQAVEDNSTEGENTQLEGEPQILPEDLPKAQPEEKEISAPTAAAISGPADFFGTDTIAVFGAIAAVIVAAALVLYAISGKGGKGKGQDNNEEAPIQKDSDAAQAAQ